MIPQMIVVSIHNIDRNRDFLPVHVDRIPSSGGAEKFLGFLSEELVPYINENFRSSGFNILLGHSFGGTFAVYSLLTEPDLFTGYIAVSPALQFADNYLVNKAKQEIGPFEGEHKYFYMTVGDEPNYFTPLEEFSSTMREKTAKTVDFEYVKMETENHGTTPYLSVFGGLKYIFSDWQLPREKIGEGLASIDEHYTHISLKYGFKTETPEMIINALGYAHIQNGELNKAISVFKENVKRYPGSANVYDSLGEAYENNSELKMAAKYYQQAYDIGYLMAVDIVYHQNNMP
jgi:hypothetical protein